ncbi:hypothetical protein J4468_00370 [Candidatus Woesearchaeota archaeon]|nr:hypothetical protein [Candidatus Woesearchaeota archaeon]
MKKLTTLILTTAFSLGMAVSSLAFTNEEIQAGLLNIYVKKNQIEGVDFTAPYTAMAKTLDQQLLSLRYADIMINEGSKVVDGKIAEKVDGGFAQINSSIIKQLMDLYEGKELSIDTTINTLRSIFIKDFGESYASEALNSVTDNENIAKIIFYLEFSPHASSDIRSLKSLKAYCEKLTYNEMMRGLISHKRKEPDYIYLPEFIKPEQTTEFINNNFNFDSSTDIKMIFRQLGNYMKNHFKKPLIAEEGDYWSFPEETLMKRMIECNDQAILLTSTLIELAKSNKNIAEAYVVYGQLNDFGHMWTEVISAEGITYYFDPTNMNIMNGSFFMKKNDAIKKAGYNGKYRWNNQRVLKY